MGITLIEQIGIVAGIVIGLSGFIYSVLLARRQRRNELEQAAKQEALARELAAKQEAHERELAVKQEAHERELAVKQEAHERELAAKQEALAREQSAKQETLARLYFLANLIVDTDIPRRSRQVFFDEYVAKGGNGSFIKFWYDEEKEAEAKNRRNAN